jgi:hypothetical protein
MKRREAKELLIAWRGDRCPTRSERELRMTLAELCDLDEVARRCNAFAEFRKDLARA